MKKILLLLIFAFFSPLLSTAQTLVSKDNYTGDWQDDNSWRNVGLWRISAPYLSDIIDNVDVYGYLTADNLEFDRGWFSTVTGLQVYDTLVLNNTLDLGGGDWVYVAPDGVLVILGDLTSRTLSSIVNDGTTVVKGSINDAGLFPPLTFDNNGDFYTYDPNPDIVPYGGSNPSYSSSTQLSNDNPDIYNFVESSGSGTLPVEVSYFKAKRNESDVRVEWITESELNFDHFIILRQQYTDLTYDTVATLAGAGFSDVKRHYSFTDHDVPDDQLYYELIAVNLDGTIERHGIVAVPRKAAWGEEIKVFPNPVTDRKLIIQSSLSSNEGRYNLYNQYGNLIARGGIGHGVNVVKLNRNIPAGLYFVEVLHEGIVKTEQLIVY